MDKAKHLLFFVVSLWFYAVYPQDTCDFKKFEDKINKLIKEHEDSSEDLQFVSIGNFIIDSHQEQISNSLSGTRPFIFVFAPGRTFRFYVITRGTDAHIKLIQHAGGILKKKESFTLFEKTQKADQFSVGFYDYYLEKENEFQLLFQPGNTNEGCALMKFVEIAPLDQ